MCRRVGPFKRLEEDPDSLAGANGHIRVGLKYSG